MACTRGELLVLITNVKLRTAGCVNGKNNIHLFSVFHRCEEISVFKDILTNFVCLLFAVFLSLCLALFVSVGLT